MGPEWVPVAVIGTREITATLIAVEQLIEAELYDFNVGLIVGKLDTLGLT